MVHHHHTPSDTSFCRPLIENDTEPELLSQVCSRCNSIKSNPNSTTHHQTNIIPSSGYVLLSTSDIENFVKSFKDNPRLISIPKRPEGFKCCSALYCRQWAKVVVGIEVLSSVAVFLTAMVLALYSMLAPQFAAYLFVYSILMLAAISGFCLGFWHQRVRLIAVYSGVKALHIILYVALFAWGVIFIIDNGMECANSFKEGSIGVKMFHDYNRAIKSVPCKCLFSIIIYVFTIFALLLNVWFLIVSMQCYGQVNVHTMDIYSTTSDPTSDCNGGNTRHMRFNNSEGNFFDCTEMTMLDQQDDNNLNRDRIDRALSFQSSDGSWFINY